MKKRLTLVLFLFITSIGLSSCDPLTFRYKYIELKNRVIAVELINYNNPQAKDLFERADLILPFDFAKMEIIDVLDEKFFDSFFLDFSEIMFMEYWRHFDSPNGVSIRLIYDSSDFEIISSFKDCYAGSFDSSGNVKRFIGGLMGAQDFLDLIEDFFHLVSL